MVFDHGMPLQRVDILKLQLQLAVPYQLDCLFDLGLVESQRENKNMHL